MTRATDLRFRKSVARGLQRTIQEGVDDAILQIAVHQSSFRFVASEVPIVSQLHRFRRIGRLFMLQNDL